MTAHTLTPPLGLGLLALGADSRAALAAQLEALLPRLHDPLALAHELAARGDLRGASVRAAFFAESAEAAQKRAALLLGFLQKGGNPARLDAQGIALREGPARDPGAVAFMSPGQGSQYLGMLEELRARFPVVQQTIDEADEAMWGLLPRPLSSYLAPAGDADEAFWALSQVEVLQPAVLTHDEALRRLLWPLVQPRAVFGHSLGEYGACVAAGVLPFPDALRIIAARGEAMEKVHIPDPGKMLAVGTDETTVHRLIAGVPGYVVVVNKNCPTQTIIGGASDAVEEAEKRLTAAGFEGIFLPVSHAFHSEIVAPGSEPLYHELCKVRVSAPARMILSNVDAEPYPTGEGASEAIRRQLSRQMASPVEFIRVVERAYHEGARVFVEVGPKRAQSSFVDDILQQRDHRAVYLCHPKFGELESLGRALAALVAEGVVLYPQKAVSSQPAPVPGGPGALSPSRVEDKTAPTLASPEHAALLISPKPAPRDTEAPVEVRPAPEPARTPNLADKIAGSTGEAAPSAAENAPTLRKEAPSETQPPHQAGPGREYGSAARQEPPAPFYVRKVVRREAPRTEPAFHGTRLVLHAGLSAEEKARFSGAAFAEVHSESDEESLVSLLHETKPEILIDACGWSVPGAAVAGAQAALRRVVSVARALLRAGSSVRRVLVLSQAKTSPETIATNGAAGGAWKSFAREWQEQRAQSCALTVAELETTSGAAWDAVLRDLASAGPLELFVSARGERFELGLARRSSRGVSWLRPGMVALCIGGGRGVTSWLVRELARRYRLGIALFGRTPAPDEGRETARSVLRQQARQWLGPAASARQVAEAAEVMADQAELGNTLDDLAASGAELLYLPGDARDPEQIRRAVAGVRERFGRLDLILYGAGIEQSRRVEKKTRAELDEVIATQVAGLSALVGAAKGARLVTVGSLAGRLGNAGQIDSSAAHEAAARLTISQGGLFLGFSSWRGVGASRGREEFFRARGIDSLDPAEAARWAIDLVEQGEPGEWLLAGRLPPPVSFAGLFDAECLHIVPGESISFRLRAMGKGVKERAGALSEAAGRGAALLAPGAGLGALRADLYPGLWTRDLAGAIVEISRAPQGIELSLRQDETRLAQVSLRIE
jgi:malonyl CoA-acyl carrier protein transacylase